MHCPQSTKPLGVLEWDVFSALLGFQKSLSLGYRSAVSIIYVQSMRREPEGINGSFQKHNCKKKFLFKDFQINVLLSS